MKNVSTIVILFLLLWVLKCGGRLSYYHTCSIALGLKSRESEGRLKYYYTFSDALGTQVKRK